MFSCNFTGSQEEGGQEVGGGDEEEGGGREAGKGEGETATILKRWPKKVFTRLRDYTKLRKKPFGRLPVKITSAFHKVRRETMLESRKKRFYSRLKQQQQKSGGVGDPLDQYASTVRYVVFSSMWTHNVL